MTVLIEPANKLEPTHYILNNKCESSFNTSYNDLEAYHEAIIVDSIIYGKENIVSGEIEDLGAYTLVNELDVVTGSDSKANNKDKILYGKAKKTS
jgi:hypothetical protein